MKPMLASDFGNLGVFLLFFTTIAIAVIVGIIAAIFKSRIFQIYCAAACFGSSWYLFNSRTWAQNEDGSTARIALVGCAIGLVLLLVSFWRRKRNPN